MVPRQAEKRPPPQPEGANCRLRQNLGIDWPIDEHFSIDLGGQTYADFTPLTGQSTCLDQQFRDINFSGYHRPLHASIHPPAPSFGILPPGRRQPHGPSVGPGQTAWNGFGGGDRPWQLVRGCRISKESRPNGDQVDPWHRGLRRSTKSVRKKEATWRSIPWPPLGASRRNRRRVVKPRQVVEQLFVHSSYAIEALGESCLLYTSPSPRDS